MLEHSVITRTVMVAKGVFAPGHLGELTQVIDFALVDAVLVETGKVQRRLRLLPSRVVVYFVLALALFESCSYQAVWGKMVACLSGLSLPVPHASSLVRARRRLGPAPLKALFGTLAGPVATRGVPGAFYRGLRTVAIDGTSLHVPDSAAIAMRYPKRTMRKVHEFGYPLLRLLVLTECGTRAVLAAAFGPESAGELAYAATLVDKITDTMLVLADTAFDAWWFLARITENGAHFLVRSGARRTPLILRQLPDGSYLSTLNRGRSKVRIIEARITVTLADGTINDQQWRLVTSLLDHTRYPATELIELYHERWQVETTFFSIKATILDGRVLRSQRPEDIEQEVYALLTTYQALIRLLGDTASTHPDLNPDRFSFTIALETAREQVITANNIWPTTPPTLIGAIGTAVLARLLPQKHRLRLKARTRKNPTSKYGPNIGKHPAKTQNYKLTTHITIFEEHLTTKPRR